MRTLVGCCLLAALSAAPVAASLAQDTPITYVRCPRTETPIQISGEVTVDGITRVETLNLIGADGHEPPREFRRLVGVSQAASALSLSC